MTGFKLLYKPGKDPARNDMRGSSEGAGKIFCGGRGHRWLARSRRKSGGSRVRRRQLVTGRGRRKASVKGAFRSLRSRGPSENAHHTDPAANPSLRLSPLDFAPLCGKRIRWVAGGTGRAQWAGLPERRGRRSRELPPHCLGLGVCVPGRGCPGSRASCGLLYRGLEQWDRSMAASTFLLSIFRLLILLPGASPSSLFLFSFFVFLYFDF